MRRRPSPTTRPHPSWMLLAALLTATPAITIAQSDAELAMHWAPVIFHDTVEFDMGRRDFIAAYDFDGNDDPTDNWENTLLMDGGAYVHALNATAYYAVIESRTHYYISYFIYHPMDWQLPPGAANTGRPPALEHESDIEGVTMVIRKEPAPYGTFRAIYTQAHGDFYYFADDAAVEIPDRLELPEVELLIGSLDHLDANFGDPNLHGAQTEDGHAYSIDPSGRYAIFIETRGHGIGQLRRALHETTTGIEIEGGIYDFWGVDFDGVIYYPGEAGEEPTGPNDRSVTYALEPFATTIWPLRHSDVFFQSTSDITTYRGITLTGMGHVVRAAEQEAGANAPWTWAALVRCPDGECGNVNPGGPFLDPAQAVSQHLIFPDEALNGFLVYERNIYLLGDNDLEILAPSGGEVWTAGDVTQLDWRTIAPPDTSTGLAEQMLVELSRDDGRTWETIAASVPRTLGNWPWQITGPATDSCRIRLTAYSAAGGFLPLLRTSERLAIEASSTPLPTAFALASIIPNPAMGSTVITMELPIRTTARLDILDAPGHTIRQLVDGELQAGIHAIAWDGRDDTGDAASSGTYSCRMTADALTANGFTAVRDLVFLQLGPVERVGSTATRDLQLVTISPSPGSGAASIRFELPQAAAASLRIYDARGRLVRNLVDGHLAAGARSVVWDGDDDRGGIVAQGIYFCRLQAGEQSATRKLLLVRQ